MKQGYFLGKSPIIARIQLISYELIFHTETEIIGLFLKLTVATRMAIPTWAKAANKAAGKVGGKLKRQQ